jgi:hypothetical protein
VINTVEGSQKHKNVVRNPKVALDICDPTNPYNMARSDQRASELNNDSTKSGLIAVCQIEFHVR